MYICEFIDYDLLLGNAKEFYGKRFKRRIILKRKIENIKNEEEYNY